MKGENEVEDPRVRSLRFCHFRSLESTCSKTKIAQRCVPEMKFAGRSADGQICIREWFMSHQGLSLSPDTSSSTAALCFHSSVETNRRFLSGPLATTPSSWLNSSALLRALSDKAFWAAVGRLKSALSGLACGSAAQNCWLARGVRNLTSFSSEKSSKKAWVSRWAANLGTEGGGTH